MYPVGRFGVIVPVLYEVFRILDVPEAVRVRALKPIQRMLEMS